jgi:DNA-binding IclR family transcriptional regulator
MSSARDRALAIVELLAHNVQGLALSQIADQLRIPRSAAHRLLAGLKDTGYVRQDALTTHYQLTVRLAALGLTYLSAVGVADAVQPLLDELAASCQELVRLAVIEGDELIWVARSQGSRAGLRYDPDTGSRVYLPASANGLAWLAAVDDARAHELVAAQGMDRAARMGPGAPRTVRALMKEVEQIRRRGYACVVDAYEAGTSAIAAAVRTDASAEPIGTLSIAGPTVRMTPARMQQLAPQLLACARFLAQSQGGSPLFARRTSA